MQDDEPDKQQGKDPAAQAMTFRCRRSHPIVTLRNVSHAIRDRAALAIIGGFVFSSAN
jgi:hypothetical protein